MGRGKEPTTSVGMGIVVNLDSRNDKQVALKNVAEVFNNNRSRTTLQISREKTGSVKWKMEKRCQYGLSGESVFDYRNRPWLSGYVG